jgi:hypothetical protein
MHFSIFIYFFNKSFPAPSLCFKKGVLLNSKKSFFPSEQGFPEGTGALLNSAL